MAGSVYNSFQFILEYPIVKRKKKKNPEVLVLKTNICSAQSAEDKRLIISEVKVCKYIKWTFHTEKVR